MGSLVDEALRDALVFARSHPRPVTADELAAAQGIHRNVARGRLERLVRAGFLIADFERRSGRSGPGAGRPAKTYSVAPETTPFEFTAGRYDELLALLLDALAEDTRAKRLREIGAEYGRRFAHGLRPRRTLRGALTAASTALRRAGFHAVVAEARDGEAVIATPTCPLRSLVCANPRARQLDRGLWEGLITRLLGDGSRVVVESSGCEHRNRPCFVHVHAVNTNQRF